MASKLLDNETLKKLHYFNYQALIEAYQQLIDILQLELSELREKEITINEKWQEIKNDLSSFIKTQAKILGTYPEINENISSEDKQKIKELAQKMLDLTEEYRKTLVKRIYANETVLKIAMQTTKQEAILNENYNERGEIEPPPRTQRNLAVALDKMA